MWSTFCHGRAVRGVLSSLLAAGMTLAATSAVGGCRRDRETSAEGRNSPSLEGDRAPQSPQSQSDADQPLPPPELTREELERRSVPVPEGLGDLRPAAELPVGESSLVYTVNGPLRLRVVRANVPGVAVAEVEAEAGQVLVVDRARGILLGREQLRRGPLDDQTVYLLFALPSGGVRSEVTRTLIRPQNPQERRAAAEELRQQEEAGTQPATRPAGG